MYECWGSEGLSWYGASATNTYGASERVENAGRSYAGVPILAPVGVGSRMGSGWVLMGLCEVFRLMLWCDMFLEDSR